MATRPPAILEGPRRSARTGGVEERYESLFAVGRGGMGSVEVALERSPEGFERIVALKRLLPEGAADPRHKEMFLREARLAALLAHPNVVHAFAFGEIYGELFIAMEYVEGEPLSRLLAAARDSNLQLDPALVARLLAEVCDGLHAAHELSDTDGRPLGVVHRDVSPHNVMISYTGHVKLLDFGVAKFEGIGSSHTRTGEVKGKMAYMSPEQALGEPLDRRSDLFSVGAVLFECLTGKRMWGAGTDLDIMRKLALESPPRLDHGAAPCPPALADLHARLVARDPELRPTSARDVAEPLRAFASSASPAPGTSALCALMTRLFADETAERRAQLVSALESAAPSRVDILRRSLEPGAGVDRPTRAEAIIVRGSSASPWSALRAEDRTTAVNPARRKVSRWMVVLALVGIALVGAAGVGSAMRAGARPQGAAVPEQAAATKPVDPVATSTAAIAPPTPLGAATAASLSTSSATTAMTAHPTTRGPAVRPRARPATAAPKPPDVDPTPF